ncbi:MAG TPA: hypothetical protein VKW76_09880 [Candidatus Binatia bacterium]|nr:hypothetical protein [Candidatus Binatia bacterium]
MIIPLRPAHPGGARLLETGRNKGKLEITVESETPLDDWLVELEARLRELPAGSGFHARPPVR